MPPIVWVGGIVSLSGTLFCLRIEAIAAVLRRRAAVHFPSGNGPPPCMRHRLTADECPHWDSNPEHKDFKSSVSANWTMGAHPASSEHKHLLFHENAPEPKQKHISNGSPRSATAITTQKHRWATKPGSWRASGHKNGRCRRPKSSTPPFALSQVRYLREHTPKSGYFRALPSGVPVQYRLLPGMPGAGSAGGESRRCRGRKSGSEPRWS